MAPSQRLETGPTVFRQSRLTTSKPIVIFQKVLGHESTTTLIYIDRDEEVVRQAHYKYSPVDDEIDSNWGSL